MQHGEMNKEDLASHQSQSQFGGIFVIMQKMLGEKANKIDLVCKVMIVLYIFNRIFGYPLPGYP